MDKRFSGNWRIEEVEVWGGGDLDLLGPANITFDDDGYGGVQFVALVGLIDCYFSERNGLRWSNSRGKGTTIMMMPVAGVGASSKVTEICVGASSFNRYPPRVFAPRRR